MRIVYEIQLCPKLSKKNLSFDGGLVLSHANSNIFCWCLSGSIYRVTWKRLNTETAQHGNASKKQNHKTNLMSSSLNLKLKRLYSNDFHSHGRSARPPSLF